MKTTLTQLTQVTFTLCLVAALSACQPAKKSATAATVGGTVGSLNTAVCGMNTGMNSGVNTGINPAMNSSLGSIFDSTNAANFEGRVKALLSATMQPTDVGSVSAGQSDSTGLRFTGTIKLDAAGNVVSAQSKMLIDVYDSIYVQNKTMNTAEQPIQVYFMPTNGATLSGNFNLTTGVGYVQMQDSYGLVRFDGKIDAQYFSGTVSFQNSQTVVGGSPASGMLGQFLILSCGIIQK